jgi:hypothetical protein
MGVLLILAVVVGVAVGVGFTTWQLSRQDTGRYVWVVDAASDLSELENSLNHLSEQGFRIHRILSAQPEKEHPPFVIVGRRAGHTVPEPSWI